MWLLVGVDKQAPTRPRQTDVSALIPVAPTCSSQCIKETGMLPTPSLTVRYRENVQITCFDPF
jgi:hypothetical protein